MKHDKIKEIVKKAIIEVIMEAPAAPEIAPPPTKPTTEPTPKTPPAPSKPAHPLQPRPGQRPRPKAQLSHDVQLFLKNRGGIKEAIDIGDNPDFIDPGKRASIEDEHDYVENILPDLGPAADRYLEIITSESYKNALNKAAYYLGIQVNQLPQIYPNIPTAMGILMSTAREVENLERNSKPQLEKMAVDVVLNLPENKLIKQLVDAGEIKIDIKLAGAELANAVAEEEMDEMMVNELTLGETLNAQIYSVLTGESEGKLRRALANLITQGDAINKFFLFNVVNEQLTQINPTLPQKYGLLSATSLILNYWMPNEPFTRGFMNSSAVGSEEVVPDEDGTYTIKVRGRNFPLLIHELVKGINEYISLDVGSQEEMDTEVLSDEMRQFLIGPGLDLRLRKMIPSEKAEYIPLIKKMIYQLPIPEIKELFSGGGKSAVIMKKIIQTAEQQMKDSQKANEPEEPGWKDTQ